MSTILDPNYSGRLQSIRNSFTTDVAAYNQAPTATTNETKLRNDSATLFTLQSEVQGQVETLNTKISILNAKLSSEQAKYNTNLNTYNQKKGTNSSAYSLIFQSKESYKYQYMENITIFLGDILLLYVIYRYMKK